MAILKIVKSPENSYQLSYISEKIRYILQPEKIEHGFYGGCGFLLSDIESIIYQFYKVRELCNKAHGIQLRHLVLSFSKDYREYITPYQASCIAHEICNFLYPMYQCIYAIHEDTAYVHAHILINTVNVDTGKLLDMNKAFCNSLEEEITFLVKLYGQKFLKYPMKLIVVYE